MIRRPPRSPLFPYTTLSRSQPPTRDAEPDPPLRLHEREPQPPPQADSPPLSPQRLHRRGGVALAQRREVRQTAAFARATRWFQSARNCSSPDRKSTRLNSSH